MLPRKGALQKLSKRNMKDIMELCDVVRETAFAIHRYHKHGHLEKVSVFALLAPFRGY